LKKLEGTSTYDVLLLENLRLEGTGQRLIDMVYAAGYLDAEGCIRFHSTTRVSISNTYPLTLFWFKKLFGGTVRERINTKAGHRQAYEWACSGETARNCIKEVLPFLKEKLPQAVILLQILKYPNKSAKRTALVDELKKLKRINYLWNQ
jgi:hypothetical protein